MTPAERAHVKWSGPGRVAEAREALRQHHERQALTVVPDPVDEPVQLGLDLGGEG